MKGKTIAECRPHWCRFIVQGVLGFGCLAYGIWAILNRDTLIQNGSGQAAPFALFVGIVCFVYIFITYKFTYISLTETKVEGHIGFIRSKTLSTPISKVQGISLSNGLLGKIFRYHTVSISSAGTAGTEYVFKHMAHAKEFANAFDLEAEKLTTG